MISLTILVAITLLSWSNLRLIS